MLPTSVAPCSGAMLAGVPSCSPELSREPRPPVGPGTVPEWPLHQAQWWHPQPCLTQHCVYGKVSWDFLSKLKSAVCYCRTWFCTYKPMLQREQQELQCQSTSGSVFAPSGNAWPAARSQGARKAPATWSTPGTCRTTLHTHRHHSLPSTMHVSN